jgi:hypothetical protein
MKVLLSFIIGLAVAGYTAYNIHQAVQPWVPKIIDMCMSSANTDVEGNLRVLYTGYSTLDRVICFYVNFTQQPLHDVVGAPLMRLLMGCFASVYAIMAYEGSRKGFKNSTLLAAFPLLGLLSNLIGISLVFPLFWVPLSLYYIKNKATTNETLSITMPEAYGVLFAIIFGYGMPSALVSSPIIKDDTKFEQDALAVWLVLPILIVPLFTVMENVFKWVGSPVDQVTEPALRNRLQIAEGKDALERSYLFIGVLNMFLYFGSYLQLSHLGIRVWDSILMLLNAPGTLPAGLTFGDLGQLLGTRTVLVEYISLAVSFVLWATFNSGLMVGLCVAFACPIVGPGAAVAYYAYYRENKIQDISDAEETERVKVAAAAAASASGSDSIKKD